MQLTDIANKWSTTEHPKHHTLTKALLTGQVVTANDLRMAVGDALSPRTLAAVIRAIEDQHVTVLRQRHQEWGVMYRVAPEVPYSVAHRITKPLVTEESGDEPPPLERRR